MKKIVCSIFFLLVITSFCFTVFGQGRQDSLKYGPKNLKARLNLTDAQTSRFDNENMRFQMQMKIIMQSSDSATVKQQNTRALYQNHNDSLQNILTTQQYQKYTKHNNDRRKNKQKNFPNKVFINRTGDD